MNNFLKSSLTAMLMTTACAAAIAKGQYQRVGVKTVAITPENGMSQVLIELRSAIDRKDRTAVYGMLAKKFVLLRDLGGAYNPKFSARRQFDEVMPGWDYLTSFASAKTWGPADKGSKHICGPAPLTKADELKIIRAAKQRGDDVDNTSYEWLYVDIANVAVHEKPDASASKIATLSHEAVRALGGDEKWTEIGLPDGTIGFTQAANLVAMQNPRICFAKIKGKWRISGYMDGGD